MRRAQMSTNKLPETEDIDFHYLLGLMPPLHNVPEYAWLPELFSIIGHEKLVILSKYAGGETIRIPTLVELLNSVDALQWFYDVHITKKKTVSELPTHLHELYLKILEVYDVRDSKSCNS